MSQNLGKSWEIFVPPRIIHAAIHDHSFIIGSICVLTPVAGPDSEALGAASALAALTALCLQPSPVRAWHRHCRSHISPQRYVSIHVSIGIHIKNPGPPIFDCKSLLNQWWFKNMDLPLIIVGSNMNRGTNSWAFANVSIYFPRMSDAGEQLPTHIG